MKLKRLVAGVLSAAMMLSVGSTLAFADDDPTATISVDITFDSTLTLSKDAVTAPDVTYTYTLGAGTDEDAVSLTGGTSDITGGGIVATGDIEVDVVFTTKDIASVDSETSTNVVTKSATLNIALVDLDIDSAGFYVYTLTQSSDSADTNFTDNNGPLYLYLQIENVMIDGTSTLSIADTLLSEKTLSTEKVTADGFVNYYGIIDTDDDDDIDDDDAKDEDDEGNSLSFEVEAYSFGSLADSSEDFEYTVQITTAYEGAVYNVAYGATTVQLIADKDGYLYEAELVAAVGDDAAYYQIKTGTDKYVFLLAEANGTKIFTIKAVVGGDKIAVSIYDTEDLGYSAEYREMDAASWDGTASAINSTNGIVIGSYDMVAYVAPEEDETTDNALQGLDFATIRGTEIGEEDDDQIDYDSAISLPDTGVILEFAPFALMVLAAGAFISLRAISASKQRK